MSDAKRLVDQQAEDEGLWFVAQTAAEGYLQQELRRLHAVVELDALRAQEGMVTDPRIIKARHIRKRSKGMNWKPYRARIVFRARIRPTNPISTIAWHEVRGVAYGRDRDEVFADIERQYPGADVEIVGLDNQRVDYEMIFGMFSTECKFADS